MRKLILLPGGLLLLLLGLGFLLLQSPAPEPGPGVERLAAVDGPAAPEVDLPPAGTRSLFDHLIAENGSLPYPFDRLLDMLTAYDVQGRPPRTLLIPDGRSLLKGSADYAAPRIVVAADMTPPAGLSLPPVFRGRLFLGFVDGADEIEVLSYNDAAGRFEFQLVENYCADCVPRIVYAQRAICKSCHTGAAPIFPVRPWQETNVQPDIARRIAAHHPEAYFGAPVERKLEDAEAFDNLTDIANVIPTTQRIWGQGCGGAACRRLLLRLALRYALNPAALDVAGEDIAKLQVLQADSWPAGGIALANGDLANRDPLDDSVYQQSLWQKLRALVVTPPERQLTGDKLTDFDSLPPLPAALDPLSPRPPKKRIGPDELDGVYGLAQLFTPADIRRLEDLAGYEPARLEAAVASLDTAVFESAVADRIRLMRALVASLGGGQLPHCCSDTAGMSEPILQGEPPLELTADSPLQPFERYCFACHRGNPSAKLNFMAGTDETAVLENIRAADNVREVLDYERYLGSRKEGSLMPPADSWQRAALEEDRAAGGTPLEAMREQVPALFDF